MPVSAGTAYIELRARLDQFEKDLKAAEAQATKSSKTVEKRYQSIGRSAGNVANKTKFMSAAVGAGLIYAGKKASDLNEAMNVTGLVFKDARGEIDEFAKGAAESIGQSETAAREATATFGGLLNNMDFAQQETIEWSKTLTILASDLASAFNTDPADAAMAIGAAIRGETEPIRRFNVTLSDAEVRLKAVEMGLADSTAEVDKNGKAQAVLASIMEQTKDVQGDFANTATESANAQRIAAAQVENAAASLGESLAPIMGKTAEVAAELASGFAAMSDEAQTGTVVLLGLLALTSPLAKGVELATAAWGWYTTAATTATGANARLAASFLGRAGLIVAVGALGKELDAIVREKYPEKGLLEDTWVADLANGFNDAAASLIPFSDRIDDAVAEMHRAEVPMDGWVSGAIKMAESAKKTADEVDKAGKESATFADRVKTHLGGSLDSVNDAFEVTGDVIAAFGEKTHYSTDRFIEDLKKRAQEARDMKENMDKAVRKGLSPQAVAEILAQGPEVAAHAFADLADSSKKKVGTVNTQLAVLARVSNVKLGGIKDDADRVKQSFSNATGGIHAFERELERLPSEKRIKVTATYVGINAAEGDATGGGIGAGPLGTNLISIGRNLQAQGFRVSEHPAFGGVLGGHSSGSYHYMGRAIDINWGAPGQSAEEMEVLTGLGMKMLATVPGIAELLGPWNDLKHKDHLHLAMDTGGWVKGPATVEIGNIRERVHFTPESQRGGVTHVEVNVNVPQPGASAGEIARVARREVTEALAAANRAGVRRQRARQSY